MEHLVVKNPSTGAVLATLPKTSKEEIQKITERSRAAQAKWVEKTLKQRLRLINVLKETLLDQTDAFVEIIAKETGKPNNEALLTEVFPSVEHLSFLISNGIETLQDKPIFFKNPLFRHRFSYINHFPYGTVAVLSPWNFPLFFPIKQITNAVFAGNSVVFKPHELTPLTGLKIQELFDISGFPSNLLSTVIGDDATTETLLKEKPDKIFFVGERKAATKIDRIAQHTSVPVQLETNAKNLAIVLPDAHLDFSTSAILWGSYANSGQMLYSTEHVLIHESIHKKFNTMLGEKIQKLKQSEVNESKDLGVITNPKLKVAYKKIIEDAKKKRAELLCGGALDSVNRSLSPTVIINPTENLLALKEETLGPIIVVEKYKTLPEAVKKANATPYGQTATLLTKNIHLGEEVSRQLQFGTITINDTAFMPGIPESRWIDLKSTNAQTNRYSLRLHNFVKTRQIYRPRSFLPPMKSIWWFPYSTYQYDTFKKLLDLYRRNPFSRLLNLPLFIWNFMNLIKKEKRI